MLVALKIGKLAAGAGDYYTAMVADGAEEYYTTTREAPGEWVGSTAQRLGLAGTVRPDDFTPVIEHRCDEIYAGINRPRDTGPGAAHPLLERFAGPDGLTTDRCSSAASSSRASAIFSPTAPPLRTSSSGPT
ncbi:MAG TPA: relaxase domain-containing protein [Microthrixaceae bacterium]|nr:relaxase domain-containing protein [Microthrixaceae bacterium]